MTAPLKALRAPRSEWVISEHAADRYRERIVPGVTRRLAREHLRWHCEGAHFVKMLASGIELWRGPKPRRLRLRVERNGARMILVTVIETFDGLRRCH